MTAISPEPKAIKMTLPLKIEKSREGEYFTLPFTVPANIESLTLRYQYQRYLEQSSDIPGGSFKCRTEVNIIDLGLIAPDGGQVGASGSDKVEFTVSETFATPGYHPHKLDGGEWQIIVGAYKVADEGVQVTYEIELTPKSRRLLKGDLHMHTVASDGVHTVQELAWKAASHGLDFLAITDHNQPVSADALPHTPGVTLIPGIEWTHYKGHSGFIGLDKAYEGSFIANTPDEVAGHFRLAHERGALIVIDHPFDEGSPFLFDMNTLPFDLIEVWNGPMRESNLKALVFWHSLLVAGKKSPICGGSDYHRDTPFLFLGGPTTCVYALSAGASDILQALRQGHAYIIFAPNGPTLEMHAGDAILGDSVSWQSIKEVHIHLEGLLVGDVVRVITNSEAVVVMQTPSAGSFDLAYPMQAPGFARVEVLRSFLPSLPLLPALIANPIYFE
jgi:hypothetical protein